MISHKINDVAFRLELHHHMNLYPVFHVSLLEHCASTSIPDRVFPPPPPVYLAEGPKYEVQAILDSKFMHNKLYYLVDWIGYMPNDRTWEPTKNVGNAPQHVGRGRQVELSNNLKQYGVDVKRCMRSA
jgi:hypothetical protein